MHILTKSIIVLAVVCAGVWLYLQLRRKRNREGFRLDSDNWSRALARRIFPSSKDVYITTASYTTPMTKLPGDSIRVLMDGEPHSLAGYTTHYDLILSTKLQIEGVATSGGRTNIIYLPFYSQSFAEMRGYTPRDLILLPPATKKTRDIAYLYSNCKTKYEGVRYREALFDAFLRYTKSRPKGERELTIDGMGKCRGEARTSSRKDYLDEAIEIYSQYRFVIAVENVFLPGYVTEKIVLALLAGAVPIYMGAPDIESHFSPGCFISGRNFDTMDSLVEYVAGITDEHYSAMQRAQRLQSLRYFGWFFGDPDFYGSMYRVLGAYAGDTRTANLVHYRYTPLGPPMKASKPNPVKIINLASSTDRWDAITARMRAFPSVHYERFSAIRGADYTDAFKNKIRWLCRSTPIKAGELGIYLSAMELYSALLTDISSDYYIILEDDTIPLAVGNVSFANIHTYIRNAPVGWDVLFLGVHESMCKQYKRPKSDESKGISAVGRNAGAAAIEYLRMTDVSCMPGTFAYAVSKKGAQFLTNFALPIEEPIDGYIQANFGNLDAYLISPEVITVNYDEAATTIHNTHDVDGSFTLVPTGSTASAAAHHTAWPS